MLMGLLNLLNYFDSLSSAVLMIQCEYLLFSELFVKCTFGNKRLMKIYADLAAINEFCDLFQTFYFNWSSRTAEPLARVARLNLSTKFQYR